MFRVVADVNNYNLFVPWCRGSKVLLRKGDDYFEAELEVGFQLFNERYTSKVTLQRPNRIVCRVDNSQLFHYLDNLWDIKPGPTPQSCWVSLNVDFEFKNPLYRQASPFLSFFFNSCVQVENEKPEKNLTLTFYTFPPFLMAGGQSVPRGGCQAHDRGI